MRRAFVLVTIMVAAITMAAVMLVPDVVATTVKHAASPAKKGLVVTQTSQVLDDAGVRCASSTDATTCVKLKELLYPVHAPIGAKTYDTTYEPNEFGTLAVVKTNDPTIKIGDVMSGQVKLGSHGAALPEHTFYKSTGWHHFPCFCLGGKILQSIQVHAFEFCTFFSGCPQKFGSYGAYALTYLQQIYGAFVQPWHLAVAYADANYTYGPSFRAGGSASANYFSDGNPGQSGFHYTANSVMGLDACENAGVGGAAYINYAADQMFTGEGDYTEAGWIDEFPMSCVTGLPGLTNDTHMAT